MADRAPPTNLATPITVSGMGMMSYCAKLTGEDLLSRCLNKIPSVVLRKAYC